MFCSQTPEVLCAVLQVDKQSNAAAVMSGARLLLLRVEHKHVS
jgi:hypothetical protein